MEAKVCIKTAAGELTVNAEVGKRLSQLLAEAGRPIDLPCGGGGRCGNCRVRATGNLSQPTSEEIETLGADLQAGWRLACVTRTTGDCTIVTDGATPEFSRVMVDGIEVVRGSAPRYKVYGLAVDIGTTTIAAKLYGASGMLATATAKNPQAAFGADVISRIGHSLAGGTAELAQAVRSTLAELLGELCARAGCATDEVDSAVITANTAMLYLLVGRLPGSIATAPFAADWLAGESIPAAELGLPMAADAQIYLPHCMSAFVGADITTAVLASAMTDSRRTALLVDIGTNGEVVLWHDGKLTCCSTAAGPAFEGAGITCGMYGAAGAIDHVTIVNGKPSCTIIGGGKARGICGSAVVDTVAAMRRLEVMDETGFIDSDDDSFELCDGLRFYQSDVRAVQLAKSAICSGIETLVYSAGLELSQVEVLYVAGGFGGYLDMDNAAYIGLIPKELRHCTIVIGNAALSGAVMLLQDSVPVERSQQLAQSATTIDLNSNPKFFELYMDNMTM